MGLNLMNHCIKCTMHWRGSKFFQIHAVWGEIWQNRVLEPPGGLAHPPGEILDPPLHCLSTGLNLACDSYGIFELSFVYAPLHFLDSDDSPRINRVCKDSSNYTMLYYTILYYDLKSDCW